MVSTFVFLFPLVAGSGVVVVVDLSLQPSQSPESTTDHSAGHVTVLVLNEPTGCQVIVAA